MASVLPDNATDLIQSPSIGDQLALRPPFEEMETEEIANEDAGSSEKEDAAADEQSAALEDTHTDLHSPEELLEDKPVLPTPFAHHHLPTESYPQPASPTMVAVANASPVLSSVGPTLTDRQRYSPLPLSLLQIEIKIFFLKWKG